MKLIHYTTPYDGKPTLPKKTRTKYETTEKSTDHFGQKMYEKQRRAGFAGWVLCCYNNNMAFHDARKQIEKKLLNGMDDLIIINFQRDAKRDRKRENEKNAYMSICR